MSKTRAAVVLAGVAAFGCLCFTCGAGFTYLGVPYLKSSKEKGDSPVAKAKGKATNQLDKWNWQDLQDHLRSKGIETGRGQGTRGMVFAIGYSGAQPLDPYGEAIQTCNAFGPQAGKGWFVVNDYGTADAASKESARVKDVQQRDVLAWGQFVFEGDADLRAQLKKALQ
ncbi:MAG: hypothetical protein EXR98_06495 [Gemmataceae bacterium]|nr:hypothetical protein [Gemmataceae bacterium]